MTLIVERAQQIVEDLARARSRRAFLSALEQFEHVLAVVPAYPRNSLSLDDGFALASLADTVIAHVQERLDRHTDRAAVQHSLTAAVDRIRVELEAAHTFLEDGAGMPSLVPDRGLVLERVKVR